MKFFYKPINNAQTSSIMFISVTSGSSDDAGYIRIAVAIKMILDLRHSENVFDSRKHGSSPTNPSLNEVSPRWCLFSEFQSERDPQPLKGHAWAVRFNNSLHRSSAQKFLTAPWCYNSLILGGSPCRTS